MIEKVFWDTDFFGYPVGKIVIEKGKDFDVSKFNSQSNEFKLIYVFSEEPLDLPGNFKLADNKVVFQKELSIKPTDSNVCPFDVNNDSYEQLLDLSFLSGIYSRFNTDDNFENNEFHRLYKKWLDESVSKNIAFETLIYKIDGEIAGFITLEKKTDLIAQIGLIAVDPKFQGLGIAKKLISSCEKLAAENLFTSLQVATQFNNNPAMTLYKSCGFSILSNTLIYHYWTK